MSDSPQSEVRADNDRCVLNSWHEWEVEAGVRRIVLCVLTGLELRPGYPGFDSMKLDDLLADATDMMRTSASPINALRIVPSQADTNAGSF
jgi:hypothetical protein